MPQGGLRVYLAFLDLAAHSFNSRVNFVEAGLRQVCAAVRLPFFCADANTFSRQVQGTTHIAKIEPRRLFCLHPHPDRWFMLEVVGSVKSLKNGAQFAPITCHDLVPAFGNALGTGLAMVKISQRIARVPYPPTGLHAIVGLSTRPHLGNRRIGFVSKRKGGQDLKKKRHTCELHV